MSEDNEITAGISRRAALKRVGAGAALVWSAPAILKVSSAGAASLQPSACDGCSVPCNAAIGCNGQPPFGACNCWVRVDGQGCWCGPFDPCSNHQPCVTTNDCPSGQMCIENCCGRLCYAPCPVGQVVAPRAEVRANPAAYGVAG